MGKAGVCPGQKLPFEMVKTSHFVQCLTITTFELRVFTDFKSFKEASSLGSPVPEGVVERAGSNLGSKETPALKT